MDGLGEGAVARRVPGPEPDPLLAPNVHRDAERMGAERRLVRGRHDLAARCGPVAPDRLDELERVRPLDLGDHLAPVARSFERETFDEDLAARDEEVAGAQ